MSLMFQYRWEHVLVTAVIEAAKAANPGMYLGRTAIQKLVYFVQVLEVPMQFRFRIHHYGPFCDELPGALEWLQADDVIVDESREPRYSNFAPGKNWPELKQQFEQELVSAQPIIQSVARALGSMDPRMLELIATLDFSFRWVRARGGDGPWKDQAIEKFKQIKGEKFEDAEIEEWYGRLVSAKLIAN